MRWSKGDTAEQWLQFCVFFFLSALQIYCLYNDDLGPCVSVACLAIECSFSMTLLENSLFYTICKADWYYTINYHTSKQLMFHLSWWEQVVVRGLWRSKLHAHVDEWIYLSGTEFLTFIPSLFPVDYIKFLSGYLKIFCLKKSWITAEIENVVKSQHSL